MSMDSKAAFVAYLGLGICDRFVIGLDARDGGGARTIC